MNADFILPLLLGVAVLLPLASFFIILVLGPRKDESGEAFAFISVAAIAGAALCSFAALAIWLGTHWPGSHESDAAAPEQVAVVRPADEIAADEIAADEIAADEIAADTPVDGPAHPARAPGGADHGHGDHPPKPYYSGDYAVPGLGTPWVLGEFGNLRLSISYYIDTLTVCMFCMVTFIATLIHIYAMGYMHEELHAVTDHEVTLENGSHLKRPGRYHRFFQYLSLFCFSMLGLVVAGNIAMVFVFWELVGICSYFLIGFYVERKSASDAANKAFIVNRVGDFGMIIGLMALWSSLGTFYFGDMQYNDADGVLRAEQGLFSKVRPGHQAIAADGMVLLSASDEARELIRGLGPDATEAQIEDALAEHVAQWRGVPDGHAGAHGAGHDEAGHAEAGHDEAGHGGESTRHGYWLLIVAGVGIFAGCVGKSAQFPLHVWLPDAMEGPTPVSALVHSATMVAAGVYLVGRFFPVFAPEVLLVIALTGCITLFMAASIAITATDIKRVLAYSTVSQLGYMMLALGVGGWLAGMMHLITHAFFKSLLFMCSGSVIHAVHTNEMTEMGGLRKKMPVTAYTMLVGCLAIAGAGVPFIAGFFGGGPLAGVGFSGFYSKDAILEQAFSFMRVNNSAWAGLFFVAAAGGAAITSFYMFRLWYLTFAGQPRDQARHDHAHESPPVMYVPLIILAVMAITVAWSPVPGFLGALAAVVGLAIWRFMGPAAGTDDARGHAHDHAHAQDHAQDHGHGHGESPGATSTFQLRDLPLTIGVVVLTLTFVWVIGVWFVNPALKGLALVELLEQARPDHTAADAHGVLLNWVWPNEHSAHASSIVVPVSFMAIGAALTGFLLASFMYGLGWLSAADVRKQFQPIYSFLWHKWWFDELYDWVFVRPALVISRLAAGVDQRWIDWLIDGLAQCTRKFSEFFESLSDQTIIDGAVNLFAKWTHATGVSLRGLQTGSLRQYVMFIVIGTVAIFLLISFFWNPTLAG